MTYFTLATIVVLGLIAYRLARLIAHDKIGEPVRHRAYESIGRWPRFGPWLNTLATCGFCLSVYASVGAVLFYALLVAPSWPGWEILLAIPATAGAAALAVAVDLALSTYVEKHPA